jgi:hypothetical protein
MTDKVTAFKQVSGPTSVKGSDFFSWDDSGADAGDVLFFMISR